MEERPGFTLYFIKEWNHRGDFIQVLAFSAMLLARSSQRPGMGR